ncbi:hypothetical protein BHE74_00021321 [Ensete ventricosum]|nr:hypothetical protein BHE74_00021321 [Ensete ventricosum]RZR96466.1 hypothetical protein BHM03_00025496 [Ensete ventricosum]
MKVATTKGTTHESYSGGSFGPVRWRQRELCTEVATTEQWSTALNVDVPATSTHRPSLCFLGHAQLPLATLVARPSPLPPLPQRCRAQQRCYCCLPATLSSCRSPRRTPLPFLPSAAVASAAAKPSSIAPALAAG